VTTIRILACATAAALSAAAAAQPTFLSPAITLATEDANWVALDFLDTHLGSIIDPGGSVVMEAMEPEYGPSVLVTYDVQTVGLQRTVSITYEALGASFVTPEAVGLLATADGGSYGLRFRLDITDAEWDGTAAWQTATLYGDGVVLVGGSPFSFPGSFAGFTHGFYDSVSPAEAGFFGGDAAPDRFTYEITYTIVPTPGSLALLALAGVPLLRRR